VYAIVVVNAFVGMNIGRLQAGNRDLSAVKGKSVVVWSMALWVGYGVAAAWPALGSRPEGARCRRVGLSVNRSRAWK
jgi:hypothetical protein